MADIRSHVVDLQVLAKADTCHRLSKGAYDPACAPLINYYKKELTVSHYSPPIFSWVNALARRRPPPKHDGHDPHHRSRRWRLLIP